MSIGSEPQVYEEQGGGEQQGLGFVYVFAGTLWSCDASISSRQSPLESTKQCRSPRTKSAGGPDSPYGFCLARRERRHRGSGSTRATRSHIQQSRGRPTISTSFQLDPTMLTSSALGTAKTAIPLLRSSFSARGQNRSIVQVNLALEKGPGADVISHLHL